MTFPESNPSPDIDIDPDLDTATPPAITLDELHGELLAGSTEARRGNRRTLEILKNFGDVLDAMSGTVNATHQAVRALPTAGASAGGDGLSREWALALVETADRIKRIADGFSRPPAAPSGWWPGARKSADAWADAWAMQADAVGILQSHLDTLITRAGLERIETLGRPFDPAPMTAVESAADAEKPDHTVLAELLAGWRLAGGEMLRPAQVSVSRKPTNFQKS